MINDNWFWLLNMIDDFDIHGFADRIYSDWEFLRIFQFSSDIQIKWIKSINRIDSVKTGLFGLDELIVR